ncbi:MAG TPA: aldo/keto reductase [Terriglobia bacterium]|nr:aldo/keto reductase [Terriglobia bacterium]
MMTMKEFTTLGKSGLRVSPYCLGTMTFGTEWGFGASEETSRAVFNHYLEAGGNFIDTADGYTNGHSEQLVGQFVAERKLRDRLAIATKYTFSADRSNPNAGGNGRKNARRALEGSLRRLQTDYVDLYWVHAWDTVTPAEEVLASMNDLVREGKILHYGLSNFPAWYIARLATLAEKEAKEPPIALQLEYSLVERNIEREHIPAAQEFGLGICPWSPLAGGFLTGKYRRAAQGLQGEGRLEKIQGSGNPAFEKGTERNWRILEVLSEVANEVGRNPSQVALNWVATQPGVSSTIIGATKLEQLQDNLAALDFTLPEELRARLTRASAPEVFHPYVFFGQPFTEMINGSSAVRVWTPGQAPAVEESKAVKAGTSR